MNNWGLQKIWNDSVVQRENRELTKRENLWASEIGKAPVDIWLKMNAVEPTNPFNARSLRKFEAGNFWEWVVERVLERAGVLKSTQDWVSYQVPDGLEVTGKLDFLAGGDVDWNEAKVNVQEMVEEGLLPEFLQRFAINVVNHFSQKYPNGLDKKVIECKSSSSFMFDVYERSGAERTHELQLAHYLLAKDIKDGIIVYICKDDLRMLEFGVSNPSVITEEYKNWVKDFSQYIKNNEQPPKEKEVFFNEERGRFESNWKVGYSSYLTKLYGYKDTNEFNTKWRKRVAGWNRVLNRILEDKKMTAKNEEIIEDIKKIFPDFDNKVEELKNAQKTAKEK